VKGALIFASGFQRVPGFTSVYISMYCTNSIWKVLHCSYKWCSFNQEDHLWYKVTESEFLFLTIRILTVMHSSVRTVKINWILIINHLDCTTYPEYCYPRCFGAMYQNKSILVFFFDFSLYTVMYKTNKLFLRTRGGIYHSKVIYMYTC